jgi:hypothetical protein
MPGTWLARSPGGGWSLVIVLSVLAFPLLCRQAASTVTTVLESPISTADIARSIKDPLVSETMGDAKVLEKAAQIPRLAMINLCFIAAILLARRILLGGIIVSAALFLLGIIVISQQRTLSLMNNASLAGMTRGRRRRSPNPLPTARVLPPPRALSPCHRRRGPPSRLRRLPGRQRSPRPAADSPVQTAAPPCS